MSIKVIKAGFATSIQNFGTPLQGSKIQNGAMDKLAFLWGNYLLGNNQNCYSLEIAFGMAKFEILNNIWISITGAKCNITINKQYYKLWTAIKVKRGDIIEFGATTNGVRNYLNIKNGFNNNVVIDGSILKTTTNTNNGLLRFMPSKFIPNYGCNLTLNIIVNHYDNNFSELDIDYFLNKKWQISNLNNRSVYRLNAGKLITNSNFISQGNSFGSVQITPNGEPIIMHIDAPIVGGYAKIGTVFSMDMYSLSQRKSGDFVNFKEIHIVDAQSKLKFFAKLLKSL